MYIKESVMDLSIFCELTGGGLPTGDLKRRMFSYYNSLVAGKVIVGKHENENTVCGSCIQRVKTALWKFYHNLPEEKKLSDLKFTGRFVAHNMPRYVKKEIAKG